MLWYELTWYSYIGYIPSRRGELVIEENHMCYYMYLIINKACMVRSATYKSVCLMLSVLTAALLFLKKKTLKMTGLWLCNRWLLLLGLMHLYKVLQLFYLQSCIYVKALILTCMSWRSQTIHSYMYIIRKSRRDGHKTTAFIMTNTNYVCFINIVMVQASNSDQLQLHV